MRARDDLTPRRVASSWLAHERREGLAQHAPPWGGNLGVVARMKAADACDALQAPWPRCQRSRQRMTRRSPSCRRGRAQQHAHGQSRRFRYPEVASDVSVQRLAHTDRYVASDAVASRTEATDGVARSSRRTRRSRHARTPSHPSRGVC